MKKIFYSWEEITTAIDSLSEQIESSGFKPDLILSVGRGGMVPARLLSDSIQCSNVSMISAKMYTGIGTRNSTPRIGTIATPVMQKNILVVDDIIDSGMTLDCVMEHLMKQKVKSIRSAVIDVKEHVTRLPSYWFNKAKKEEWIVYPWEAKEFE